MTAGDVTAETSAAAVVDDTTTQIDASVSVEQFAKRKDYIGRGRGSTKNPKKKAKKDKTVGGKAVKSSGKNDVAITAKSQTVATTSTHQGKMVPSEYITGNRLQMEMERLQAHAFDMSVLYNSYVRAKAEYPPGEIEEDALACFTSTFQEINANHKRERWIERENEGKITEQILAVIEVTTRLAMVKVCEVPNQRYYEQYSEYHVPNRTEDIYNAALGSMKDDFYKMTQTILPVINKDDQPMHKKLPPEDQEGYHEWFTAQPDLTIVPYDEKYDEETLADMQKRAKRDIEQQAPATDSFRLPIMDESEARTATASTLEASKSTKSASIKPFSIEVSKSPQITKDKSSPVEASMGRPANFDADIGDTDICERRIASINTSITDTDATDASKSISMNRVKEKKPTNSDPKRQQEMRDVILGKKKSPPDEERHRSSSEEKLIAEKGLTLGEESTAKKPKKGKKKTVAIDLLTANESLSKLRSSTKSRKEDTLSEEEGKANKKVKDVAGQRGASDDDSSSETEKMTPKKDNKTSHVKEKKKTGQSESSTPSSRREVLGDFPNPRDNQE